VGCADRGHRFEPTIDDPGPRANLVHALVDALVYAGFGPMSLVKWAFIGVILLPLAEFAVFIALALSIGWLSAAGLLVATSAVGVLVLRRIGRADFDRVRKAVGSEGFSAIHLETPGLATLAGGILLVLPGFITDVLGALLFVPPVRRWFRATIRRAQQQRRAAGDPSVIDLTPDEWRHVSDRIEDGSKRSAPRRRKRST
jgi:UPF0716 family protein affecting phage T7 exclusion